MGEAIKTYMTLTLEERREAIADLQGDYWNCAYKEGQEGKTTDTIDGNAIKIVTELNNNIDWIISEVDNLRTALRIIAGEQQCLDNTLSNVEIAKKALEE